MFEDLPDDVLFLILDIFGLQQTIPRRYRLVSTLSRVNRRFRAFALPLLMKTICAAHYGQFVRVIKDIHQCTTYDITCVRTIHIGRDYCGTGANAKREFLDRYMPDNVTIPNLIAFTSHDAIYTENSIVPLRSSVHLKKLDICWSMSCTFPDISSWDSLNSIRLRLCLPSQITVLPLPSIPPPCSYQKITSLAIQDTLWSQWWDACAGRIYFPNLQTFMLSGATSRPDYTYAFIEQHRRLLEVNVCFPRSYRFSLPALMKLIAGNGNWRSSVIPQDTGAHLQNDRGVRYDEPMYWRGPGRDLSSSFCLANAFAFTRCPVSSPRDDNSCTSAQCDPHFAATSLAIAISRQVQLSHLPALTVLDFFHLADKLPEIHCLRIAISVTQEEGTFESFIEDLGDLLRSWTSLQSLTLSWEYDRQWRWTDDDVSIGWLIDDVVPPITLLREQTDFYDDEDEDDGYPLQRSRHMASTITLENMRQHLPWEYIESTENAVRTVMGDELNLDDAADDPHLLMQAWETRHNPQVAQSVRYLAECCPTLNKFEWYPITPFMAPDAVRWSWDITRLHVGGAVDIVTGKLTYVDAVTGPAEPFVMLVGAELERRISYQSVP